MKIYTYFLAFILHGDVPQLLRKHLIFTEDNNWQCPSRTFLLLCMSRTRLIFQDLGSTVFLLLYLTDSVRLCSNPLGPSAVVYWCNILVHAKFYKVTNSSSRWIFCCLCLHFTHSAHLLTTPGAWVAKSFSNICPSRLQSVFVSVRPQKEQSLSQTQTPGHIRFPQPNSPFPPSQGEAGSIMSLLYLRVPLFILMFYI